mgnify:CR=1 FL=1
MVKILKFPNRNSPASKEKMEELLIANEEFNKKEDEFDKALFDLFKKYKKISKYLKSTKKENNELIKGLRNSFKSICRQASFTLKGSLLRKLFIHFK